MVAQRVNLIGSIIGKLVVWRGLHGEVYKDIISNCNGEVYPAINSLNTHYNGAGPVYPDSNPYNFEDKLWPTDCLRCLTNIGNFISSSNYDRADYYIVSNGQATRFWSLYNAPYGQWVWWIGKIWLEPGEYLRVRMWDVIIDEMYYFTLCYSVWGKPPNSRMEDTCDV